MHKIAMKANFTIRKFNLLLHEYAVLGPSFLCDGIVDIAELNVLLCEIFAYAHVQITILIGSRTCLATHSRPLRLLVLIRSVVFHAYMLTFPLVISHFSLR